MPTSARAAGLELVSIEGFFARAIQAGIATNREIDQLVPTLRAAKNDNRAEKLGRIVGVALVYLVQHSEKEPLPGDPGLTDMGGSRLLALGGGCGAARW